MKLARLGIPFPSNADGPQLGNSRARRKAREAAQEEAPGGEKGACALFQPIRKDPTADNDDCELVRSAKPTDYQRREGASAARRANRLLLPRRLPSLLPGQTSAWLCLKPAVRLLQPSSTFLKSSPLLAPSQ